MFFKAKWRLSSSVGSSLPKPSTASRHFPDLPADTRLWATLQRVSGVTWGGCVYDAEAILQALHC
jgi:hypothetical protein